MVEIVMGCELAPADITRTKRILARSLTHCNVGAQYLRSLVIVPPNRLSQFVSELLSRDEVPVQYDPGPNPGHAIALPFDQPDHLDCVIVIDARMYIDQATGVFPAPDHIIESTILEECLHVELYGRTWERYRRLIPFNSNPDDHEWHKAATKIVDEYWVCHCKATIISSQYSCEYPDGTIMPLYLWYGADIDHLLAQATELIEDHQVDISVILIRYAFEPLARDSAFRTANHLAPLDGYPPLAITHPLYCSTIEPYWSAVHQVLESFFDEHIDRNDAVRTVAFHIQKCAERVLASAQSNP